MAVKIRLRRMGAKKAPFYRIVVADGRYPRDGRFIEEIGYYDPTKEPSVVQVDAEKAKTWIQNGAQPTDTVRDILKKQGGQRLRCRKEGVGETVSGFGLCFDGDGVGCVQRKSFARKKGRERLTAQGAVCQG